MLVYYFVPFIVSNRYLLIWVSNGHNSVTVQNRTHVYMNSFDHKDLGNHLLQLCPKVMKHPVCTMLYVHCKKNSEAQTLNGLWKFCYIATQFVLDLTLSLILHQFQVVPKEM